MNEIILPEIRIKTRIESETGKEPEIKLGKEPKIENGSPTTRPCANIVLYGTAAEQSTAGNIKFAENERVVISVSSVTANTSLTHLTSLIPITTRSLRGGHHAY